MRPMTLRPDESTLSLVVYATLSFLLASCSGVIGGGGGDDDGDPRPDAGSPPPLASEETCNGFDDNLDGQVDEGCGCAPGQTQECYPGPASSEVCAYGEQTCRGDGELSSWGPCRGAMGPPCDDGTPDAGPPGGIPDGGGPPTGGTPDAAGPTTIDVPLFLIGDCITATCPAMAPHPVGCEVFFTPGDPRGCIASSPTNPSVYFQAGDECDQGLVTGTLHCSSAPGAALSLANCPINKPVPIYVTDPTGCPETH